nr:uncharacterized protein LOC129137051 [Pan troglodytes]
MKLWLLTLELEPQSFPIQKPQMWAPPSNLFFWGPFALRAVTDDINLGRLWGGCCLLASRSAFLSQVWPAQLSGQGWPSSQASRAVSWSGRMASHKPPACQHGKGKGEMGWPTSFDSSQWRQFLTPALMVLTPQESRILMPSVASLPEELLLLDPGALASVLRGEGVCNKSGTRRSAGMALPPNPSQPHPKAYSPLLLLPPLYPASQTLQIV